MPLNCQVYVYPSARSGDQPVTVAITATNPGAVPIVITGGDITVTQLGDGTDVSCAKPTLPLGPGMPTVVAAGATVLVGPVTIAVHSNSGCDPYQSAPQGAYVDPQPSDSRGAATGNKFPQFTVLVGATLYGSDGSINFAGTAPLFVDVVSPPPLGFQGGFLSLSAANNLVTFLAGVL
jgi:hypothetical protein